MSENSLFESTRPPSVTHLLDDDRPTGQSKEGDCTALGGKAVKELKQYILGLDHFADALYR